MTHRTGGDTPGTPDRGTWPFAPVNGEEPPASPPGGATPPPGGATPPPGGATPPFGGATQPPAGATPGAAPPPTRRSIAQGPPPTGPPPIDEDEDEDEDEDPRRRPPLWLLIVIGVALLGIVAAVVLLLARPGPPDPLEPEVITLPEPTPTIDPVERAPGTPFFESLPSEILEYALIDYGEWDEPLVRGGLEGYYLVYSDGATNVSLYAGQWRDPEGAEAAFDLAVAAAAEAPVDASTEEPAEEPAADDAVAEGEETEPAPEPEEGIVEVDGQQVGRYLLMPRSDGTGSLWWTNQTVLLQLDGPIEDLRDLFTAFPL